MGAEREGVPEGGRFPPVPPPSALLLTKGALYSLLDSPKVT